MLTTLHRAAYISLNLTVLSFKRNVPVIIVGEHNLVVGKSDEKWSLQFMEEEFELQYNDSHQPITLNGSCIDLTSPYNFAHYLSEVVIMVCHNQAIFLSGLYWKILNCRLY